MKLLDSVSTVVITVGGISTIAAVSLVFVCLLWVALPIFRAASLRDEHRLDWPGARPGLLHASVDEYRLLAWAAYQDGTLATFRLDTGESIRERNCVSSEKTSSPNDHHRLQAVSFLESDNDLALVQGDGQVRLGTVSFQASFVEGDDVPAALQASSSTDVPQRVAQDGAVYERTVQGQCRRQSVVVDLSSPLTFSSAPVLALAHAKSGQSRIVAAVTADNHLRIGKFRERKNLATGQIQYRGTVADCPLDSPVPSAGTPDASAAWRISVSGRGDLAYVIHDSGRMWRYDLRGEEPSLQESIGLFPEPQTARVSTVALLNGGETLLVGDSRGMTTAWFLVRHQDATTSDGSWLLPVHRISSQNGSPVTAFGVSPRSRLVAIGHHDGTAELVNVTSENSMLRWTTVAGEPVERLLIAPKEDGVISISAHSLWRATLECGHPEASWNALFRPLWYEGYEHPDTVWQSSFAGVQSEMKLGLIPLIFGTLKATVYAMLFGVPLALLAAIYTSEFLEPRRRNRIKSAIEMMASLPSVVLGFIGGLVIAPIAETILPSILMAFVTLPMMVLCGAFLWQQLPTAIAVRYQALRLWGVGGMLLLGAIIARRLGPFVERTLFGGDIMQWLDGQIGTAHGGWFMVWLPLSAMLTFGLISWRVNPLFCRVTAKWQRPRIALANLFKFVLGVAFTVSLALLAAYGCTRFGWDPRGTLVDTYIQRNAMVVGFVMGFAIIPLIYTISEDALSTVPHHLRSASLGAGATPLQTAVRIVVPTAMSGLFSAIMIGLGRAVGETMIVLMAAGNTPIKDWNPFNGFRTLSANIAVELPEAVRDSTHYRTLFLAALTLLFLTFIINTLAELVRIRFRRRAVQL